MNNYMGYGFSLWNDNINEVKDFIITVCVYKKLLLAGKLNTHSLNNINKMICRIKVAKTKEDIQTACRKPVSKFIADVINYTNTIDMLDGISYKGKEYLVFVPKHPWELNEKEKTYTKQDMLTLLTKYRNILGITEEPHKIFRDVDEAVLSDAEKCLVDNGIEPKVSAVVLRTLGHILMDTELYSKKSLNSNG